MIRTRKKSFFLCCTKVKMQNSKLNISPSLLVLFNVPGKQCVMLKLWQSSLRLSTLFIELLQQ